MKRLVVPVCLVLTLLSGLVCARAATRPFLLTFGRYEEAAKETKRLDTIIRSQQATLPDSLRCGVRK